MTSKNGQGDNKQPEVDIRHIKEKNFDLLLYLLLSSERNF
jgi:hypothetical protein